MQVIMVFLKGLFLGEISFLSIEEPEETLFCFI